MNLFCFESVIYYVCGDLAWISTPTCDNKQTYGEAKFMPDVLFRGISGDNIHINKSANFPVGNEWNLGNSQRTEKTCNGQVSLVQPYSQVFHELLSSIFLVTLTYYVWVAIDPSIYLVQWDFHLYNLEVHISADNCCSNKKMESVSVLAILVLSVLEFRHLWFRFLDIILERTMSLCRRWMRASQVSRWNWWITNWEWELPNPRCGKWCHEFPSLPIIDVQLYYSVE
jgi:hypothetical protein